MFWINLVVILHGAAVVTAGYCSSYYNSFGDYQSGFSCPGLWDDYDERYCCGYSTYKYCCDYDSYYLYTDDNYWVTRAVVGSLFGIGGLIFFIVILSCCLCSTCPLYKRRHQGRVIAAAGTTTVVHTGGTAVIHSSGTSGGMVHYPQYNYSQYPANPSYQPQQPGVAAPMPPPYAPAYPPPTYPSASGSHQQQQQPPSGPPEYNLYAGKY